MDHRYVTIREFIYDDNLDEIKNILDNNPDFDINHMYDNSSPLIVCAAASYKINILKYFINHPNTNINLLVDERGYNILIYVIVYQMNNYIDIVNLLLDRGININHVTHTNTTALRMSIMFNQIDVTRILLEHGADINIYDIDHARKFYPENKELIILLENYTSLDIKDPGCL